MSIPKGYIVLGLWEHRHLSFTMHLASSKLESNIDKILAFIKTYFWQKIIDIDLDLRVLQ